MLNKLSKKMSGVVVLGMATLFSCTISSVEPTSTETSTAVAFEHATMKPFFDTYCSSCHASGKSNYRDWLYDASNYTTSIKANIATLHNQVYVRKSMPENTTLSTAQLAAFKAWYDAGYAAK